MSRYPARVGRLRSAFAAITATMLAVTPAAAGWGQVQQGFGPSSSRTAVDQSRTAKIGTTAVGQRQVAPIVDPDLPGPYGRIENRVPNRVQNRLSNRIDPNYRASTGVADPFRVATREAEISKGKKPR